MVLPARQVVSLDFSPDGKTLATLLQNGTVSFWDWKMGQEQATFQPAGQELSFGFNPDGHTLATLSGDGVVRIWPVGTDQDQSLKKLLAQGCEWLQPYLESNPDQRKVLPCPSTINQQ